MIKRSKLIQVILFLAAVFFGLLWITNIGKKQFNQDRFFDGQQALRDVEYQVSLGPRIPGSEAHELTRDWIIQELSNNNWDTLVQQDTYQGVQIYNLIAGSENIPPKILIGAHYDSRLYADRDPNNILRTHPVPGANDGASGVAVLIELARIIPDSYRQDIWLVFFDAEDQGGINGWDWIAGSSSFVETFSSLPEKVIIIDMIGDKDLEIYYENNSDPTLASDIWTQASLLGYHENFRQEVKYNILDDHIPFIQKDIKSVLIIDFDYPYWHTTHDTVDKVSADSLKAVGDTLYWWIINQTKDQ